MYDSDDFEMYLTQEHGFHASKIPLRIFRRQHGPTAPAPLHSHDFWEIAVVTGGSGAHVLCLPEMDEITTHLVRGDVCIVVPGEKHAFSFRPGESIQLVNILFSPVVVQKSSAACWDEYNYAEFIRASSYASARSESALRQITLTEEELEEVCGLIGGIERELSRKQSGYSTMVQAYFTAILTLIVRCCRRDSGSVESGKESGLVSQVLRYVDLHFRKKITLEELAALTHFSPRHITRKFHAVVGIPLSAYILAQRLADAKSLLATTDIKISDVALQSGFGTAAHFCQQFREETGYTPKQYRDSRRA